MIQARTITGYDYTINEVTGEEMLVHQKTGEVVPASWVLIPKGSYCRTPDQIAAGQRWREHQQQLHCWRTVSGPFVFVQAEGMLNPVKPATATRLIYLATFLDYHDVLYKTERTRMKRKDLPSLLGISASGANRFWKEVEGRYIYEAEDGELRMNSEFFHRGELSGVFGIYQQIYVKPMRSLYRNTNASQHKCLGYVFKMLPYLNTEYNIFCQNPNETEFEEIEPLTVDDFCRLIDYNQHNRARLMEKLAQITFSFEEHEERFCSITGQQRNLGAEYIRINPHVIYHGHDAPSVQRVGRFCA